MSSFVVTMLSNVVIKPVQISLTYERKSRADKANHAQAAQRLELTGLRERSRAQA